MRTAFQLTQAYDPAGRLAEQRAGGVAVFSGMPPAPGELVRHYDWDRAGRLAGIRDAGAGGVRGETRFHHDLRDQTVAVERPGAREAYRYDALMNLAEGLAGEHRYWRDCVVEAGPNRFRYDARGRMVERVLSEQGFRPRRWRYRWDGFDRLVELETPDGARWRYSYDAFGRRVGKTLLDGAATRRVDYVWQGISLAEAWYRSGHRTGEGKGDESLSIERWHFEPDGLRPLTKELVPSGADAEPVLAEAQWLPIVADQLGAPHALFGEDGQCQWRAEPELWGRTRTARALLRERGGSDAGGEGDTAPCALRFPGQWEDAESGLHYNLNRYYDPGTGQYLSPDPIGVDGGLRTHAYVHDPLRWMDPEGLQDAPGTVTYPLHPTLSPQSGSYSSGITRAWAQEQQLVRETGRGTVNWTSAQQQELLNTGRVRGYTGHHINNAATAPAWEGDPRNIRFLSNGRAGLPNDHLYADQGHRGNWQNSTRGRLIDRMEMVRRFRAGCL